MKKAFWLISGILLVSLAFLPSLCSAAEFTADADIEVQNITHGDHQITFKIFSGSKAASLVANNTSIVVTNVEGYFRVGSVDSSVVSIKATKTSDGSTTCADNLTLGTSYFSVPTTAGEYTVVPQSNICDEAGSPGGATAGSSGSGGGSSSSVEAGETLNLGPISVEGKNLFVYENSQATFSSIGSLTGAVGNHTFTITYLNLTEKRITINFQSKNVIINLELGEAKEVDLDGDSIADIKVKFNDLIVNKIDLTITDIASGQLLTELGLAAGDLIKTSTDSAVYHIDAYGKRHLFVNEVTFWTWYGGSWSKIMAGDAQIKVKNISQTTFDRVAMGDHMTVKPASKLIKFQNSPKTYIVTKGGILQGVVTSDGDDAVAIALYGDNYKNSVILIQNGFETDYTKGDNLTKESAIPTETVAISDLF